MNEGAIYLMLQSLGVSVNETVVRRKWVNSPCPMAPWTHGGGIDEHPSFGISINPTGRSVYYCFGCSEKVRSLDWLLHAFWLVSGSYPKEAAHIFATMEIHDEEVPQLTIEDIWKEAAQDIRPLPMELVNRFPKLQAHATESAERCRRWLRDVRHIPTYVQNYFQVRHSKVNGDVVFPMTDVNRKVYVMRVRKPYSKTIWTVEKPKDWEDVFQFPTLKTAGVWFGMHLADWSKPVMLVEGEIDAMRLATIGYYNVVASATSSVSSAQIDALCGGTYILGYDNDEAGRKAHRRISKRLKEKAVLYEIDWHPWKDPGELPNREVFDEIFLSQTKLLTF